MGEKAHFFVRSDPLILNGSRIRIRDRIPSFISVVIQQDLLGVSARHPAVELPLVVGEQEIGADILRVSRDRIVKAHAEVECGSLQKSVVLLRRAANAWERFIIQPI